MNHINHLCISAFFLSKTRCKTKPVPARPGVREVRIHEMAAPPWKHLLDSPKHFHAARHSKKWLIIRSYFQSAKNCLNGLPETLIDVPASIIPLLGLTQYLRGAVVLTLKQTFLSVGLPSFRFVVTTSVKGPEEESKSSLEITQKALFKQRLSRL